MRIRFKKWARPELEASTFYIDNPQNYKGKWNTAFKNSNNPIQMELGCGKGNFIAQLASKNLNINYIAIDMVDAMLGLAKRNIESIYKEKELEVDNVKLVRHDIERILLFMDKTDKIDRIYINFCNPWPRPKHRKKRLTNTKQLLLYKEFLIPEGEVFFKTDDENLFNDSIKYFEEAGFKITNKTYDLHNESIFEDNIVTEHEKMFSDQGIKIKALIAKMEI
ncbi:MAG: tRNA (guanosine(46)-N7)-methyltransferase TrmB [Clostridia bacterium]|nr:tRNA (guanosine(46)-N7)-methyltransferase TrmB [Clostridia bacterium]